MEKHKRCAGRGRAKEQFTGRGKGTPRCSCEQFGPVRLASIRMRLMLLRSSGLSDAGCVPIQLSVARGVEQETRVLAVLRLRLRGSSGRSVAA